MKPEISIIVPVYKVEAYLKKCIDSILSQTFKDLEIILVDDGSPDECGKICDEYAEKDSRIRVIHKENGGLSSARNAGLDIAAGKYVGFVDSDDWIEPDMYEILYKITEENKAEIGVVTSKIIYSDRISITGIHGLVIHNKLEAMKEVIVSGLYDEVVWTKLFKKEVIGKERFKTGIIYEDTDFTYRVIDKCSKVVSLGKPLYNYVKRENSAMDKAVKEINLDGIYIYEEMYRFIMSNYPELKEDVLIKFVNTMLINLNHLCKTVKTDKVEEKILLVSEKLNRYFTESLFIKSYPKNIKILLFLLKINPKLYRRAVIYLDERKSK